jgi:hypothetical protein
MSHRHHAISARSIARFVALAALCSLGACVVAPPALHPPPARVVYRDAPAPMVEVVPVAPGAGYHWVPGHWAWRAGAWRWNAGHYVQAAVPPMPPVVVEPMPVAPPAAHVFVRGHWRWNGNGWVWVRGLWVPG